MIAMNNRVTYSKAVAIILMIVGHSACSIPFFVQTLYMFHMPLFFFMSGFCFKNKYLSDPVTFVKKRLKGIYWPYVKWSLIFLLFHNVFCYLHIYDANYGCRTSEYTIEQIQNLSKTIVLYMKWHDYLLGGYWFLKALLYSSMLAYLCLYIIERVKWRGSVNYIKVVLGGGILLIVIIMNHYHYEICYLDFGSQPLLATFYFLIGHLFAELKMPPLKFIQLLLAFSIVMIGGFFWRMDMGVQFYSNSKLIPNIVTAILGTWCVYSLP